MIYTCSFFVRFFYDNNLHLTLSLGKNYRENQLEINKQVQFILKQKINDNNIILYYKISMLSSKVTSGDTGKNRVL